MFFINDNSQPAAGGRIDVPLSVWSIWDDEHLIDRLVAQFTVEHEKVVLVGLPGADHVVGAGRTAESYCSEDTAEAEHAKLQRIGENAVFGTIEPVTKHTAPDLMLSSQHTAALCVCADDADRDTATWAALAGMVRPFGLLATIWQDDRPTLKSRIACEAAELSYAGHIVTARVSKFDRAVVTAEALEQVGPGVHGRIVQHVGLWTKYPASGIRTGR